MVHTEVMLSIGGVHVAGFVTFRYLIVAFKWCADTALRSERSLFWEFWLDDHGDINSGFESSWMCRSWIW